MNRRRVPPWEWRRGVGLLPRPEPGPPAQTGGFVLGLSFPRGLWWPARRISPAHRRASRVDDSFSQALTKPEHIGASQPIPGVRRLGLESGERWHNRV